MAAAPDTDGLEADSDAAPDDQASIDAPPTADDEGEVAPEADAPEPPPPAVAAAEEVAPAPTPAPHRGRALNDPRELRKAAARDAAAD